MLNERTLPTLARVVNMKVSPISASASFVLFFLHFLFSPHLFLPSSALTSPPTPSSGVASLYNSSTDFVVSLDASTIGSVFDRDRAFLLEFYASWCGHCIHFSPFYKALAEATRFWRPVIVVAAVNCADPKNVPTCRLFNIGGFPTLRLIPARAPIDHRGSEVVINTVSDKHVVPTLARKMLDFVGMHAGSNRPDHWPDPPTALIDEEKDAALAKVESAFSKLPGHNDSVDFVAIVLEKPSASSFLAKTVALDLSRLGDAIKVFAVTVDNGGGGGGGGGVNDGGKNSSLSSTLEADADSLPTVIFLTSPDLNLAETLKLSDWQKHRDSLVEVLEFKYSHGKKVEDIKVGSTSPDEDMDHSLPDLDNMLRISLLEEIGSRQSLTLEKLKAALAYVRILNLYFPGSPRTKLYLNHLYSRLSALMAAAATAATAATTASSEASPVADRHPPPFSLPIHDWYETLKSDYPTKWILPPKRDWDRCKGSSPRYRGYPCSVWTVFHAMTIAAAKGEELDDKKDNGGLQVLDAMASYVRHFFGCRHCALHFGHMYSTMARSNVTSNDEAALWLWEAHNRVNRRIRGDRSEDPAAPKIQFPSAEMCPECRPNDGGDKVVWNRDKVLAFLKKHYSFDDIKDDDRVLDRNKDPIDEEVDEATEIDPIDDGPRGNGSSYTKRVAAFVTMLGLSLSLLAILQ